ncbi:MAG: hypothetical protein IJK31_11070 [Ruminococcus sp.]|nr:hypothetical protein [Ruminococcus sp.]HRR76474.1 hypothetical protein [Ruminococcus sp.]
MIKGVTKRIIEINIPDSIYFEKAVFYLRANVRTLPPQVSENEAGRYICRIDPGCCKKKLHILSGRLIIRSGLLLSAAGLLLVFLH